MLILLILSILPKRYLRESRAKVGDLSAYSQMTCISGFVNFWVTATQLRCSSAQAEK